MANMADSTEKKPSAAVLAGCGPWALLILGAVWVVTNVSLILGGTWILEQGVLEGSMPQMDWRWVPGAALGFGLFVPLAIAAGFVRLPILRGVFRTWALAAGLVMVLSVVRLFAVTNWVGASLVQALIVFLFDLGVFLWGRRRFRRLEQAGWARLDSGWGWAVISAALVGLVWAAYGALGSPVDTLLGILNGLLLGAAAALSLHVGALEPQGEVNWRSLLMEGLCAFFTLFILAAGSSMVSSGTLLLAVFWPWLGWALVTLARTGAGEGQARRWFSPALLAGLAAAWMLIFIDGDELGLVFTGAEGDLAGWAARMAGIAAAAAFTVSLAWLVASHWAGGLLRRAAVGAAAAGLGAVILAGVYVWTGQPGFYGDRLFVILRDQADLSAEAAIPEWQARRAAVYARLTAHAEQTQQPLRQALDGWGVQYEPFYLVNGLEVRGGPLLRLWLQARPEVDRVLDSPVLRPLPEAQPEQLGETSSAPAEVPWNLTLIHADAVWELGYRGAGIVVGQSDSGVQVDHPELADGYLGRESGADYTWFDPWYGRPAPADIGGHGTHTLGTVLGNHVGVAPDAEWIACSNLARNLGSPALYLHCMQFMLAPFPLGGDAFHAGDPARGAVVLNNSWGCPTVEGCDPEALLPAVRALRTAGIFVVVSAGNNGQLGCGSVKDPPAIYAEVFSVGALNSSGDLSSFSSIGPVTVDGSQRVKPDIAAPGVEVFSATPGSTYDTFSGTSMAGPHVAGVVALMWSANPALIGEIDRTEQILRDTAQPYTGDWPACVTERESPNNAVGYGVVDALAAVKAALAVNAP